MVRRVLTGEPGSQHDNGFTTLTDDDARQRLLASVPTALAEDGWPGLDRHRLCALAGLPPDAFAEHFRSEQDCFLSAYRYHGQRLYEAARLSEQLAPGPDLVRATFTALLGFLASEPAVAELIVVRVLSSGEHGLTERRRVAHTLAALIAARTGPGPGSRTTAWALRRSASGAVAQLLYMWVAAGRASDLEMLVPSCTYLALVASIEPETAAALAGLSRGPD